MKANLKYKANGVALLALGLAAANSNDEIKLYERNEQRAKGQQNRRVIGAKAEVYS